MGPETAAGGLGVDLAALLFSGAPVVVASEVWAWLDGRLPVAELSPAVFLHQPGFGVIHWELFNRVTRVVDVALGGDSADACDTVCGTGGARGLALRWETGLLPPDEGRAVRPSLPGRQAAHDAGGRRGGRAFVCGAARPAGDPRREIVAALRIDELPQLLNVLKGDMSLGGPAPGAPGVRGSARPDRSLLHLSALRCRPGLTGWAQVNLPYARSEDEHRRKLEYDLYFIRERSLGMYFLALLRTASVTLVGARR